MASDEPTPRRRLRVGWRPVLIAAGILPLTAVLALAGVRAGEESLLDAAAAHLRQGQPEAALGPLARLRDRRFLFVSTRRRAAVLYFRLGEDKEALRMLAGQKFDADDPNDLQLRQLSSKCLRAGKLLRQADGSRDPAERVTLVRKAVEEVPDSPRLLERAVQEELLAMTVPNGPDVDQEFSEDYAALRRKAPGLAKQLGLRVRGLMGREQ
jgi:hypothetical protein